MIQLFPFHDLQNRVIFIKVKSANDAHGTKRMYRNDTELLATAQIRSCLCALGVEANSIMSLSAYALHANRMDGLTVSAAQGKENAVAIYNVVRYNQATDTTGPLGLRANVFNTAGTRAKSLFLVVADTDKITFHVKGHSCLRRIMSWCPVIPLEVFVTALQLPGSMDSVIGGINALLATTYAPQKTDRPVKPNKKRKLEARSKSRD